MPRKPISAKVVLQGEMRVVLTTFDDGETVRTVVDPNKEPTRRPRRPIARVRVKDFTRNKRF